MNDRCVRFEHCDFPAGAKLKSKGHYWNNDLYFYEEFILINNQDSVRDSDYQATHPEQ